MKIPLFILSAPACLPATPLQAALEWEKKEIALVAQRGAQPDVRAVFDFHNTRVVLTLKIDLREPRPS